MMTFLSVSLYFPILLSLSLSFILHAFKIHIIHSFFGLISTFNNNNTITNYKPQKKCQHPILSTTGTNVPPLPPPPPIGGAERLMACTESLRFESFGIENDDGDDNNIIYNNSDDDGGDDEKGDDCWKNEVGEEAEEREVEMFPPPLSSLDGNGQPSFVLLPVRKNGRLQLSKVRVKRPEILCATRADGRLRLYLVPDDGEEQEECEEEEEEEETAEETGEETEVVEEEVVEMISRYYEEEEEEDSVREWEIPAASASARGNEWFRRCHQVVHHIQYHHHVHSSSHPNHLHMYGVGIA